jgi:hypothetical protein
MLSFSRAVLDKPQRGFLIVAVTIGRSAIEVMSLGEAICFYGQLKRNRPTAGFSHKFESQH